MPRYDVRRLAPRPKGVVVKLGAIHARPGTERAYLSALNKMLREMAEVVRDDLLPQYRPRPIVADVDTSAFENFRTFAARLARTVSITVNRVLDLEKIRHTKTFMDTAKKALGVDLGSLIRNEDLDDYMETATNRNTSLIRSLSDDVARRMEQTILKNTLEGNSVKTLKKELQEQFDISATRAKLIAYDQVSKFNSDLNKIRQTQAGVDEYEWLTSADERVRPLHRRLNGTNYRWGERTGAEDGREPGQPVRCRCIGVGLVKF